MDSRKSPRTNDLFIDFCKKKQVEYNEHLKRCRKIYLQMDFFRELSDVYTNLLYFQKALIRDRMNMIKNRIYHNLSNIWIMHNYNIIELLLFFGNKPPDINNKTSFIHIWIDPEEDCSNYYCYIKHYIGETLKYQEKIHSFERLKEYISQFIMNNIKIKRQKSFLRQPKDYKPKRNSAPTLISSNSPIPKEIDDMSFHIFN